MLLKKTYIGQLFVKRKLITPEDLEAAIKRQAESSEFIGKILVDMQLITEYELYAILSEQLNIPFVSLGNVVTRKDVRDTLSAEIIYRYGIFPVKWEGSELCVAISDPDNQNLVRELRSILKNKVQFVLATAADITEAIKANYGPGSEIAEASHNISDNFRSVIGDIESLAEDDAGVLHLVNHIMINAYQNRATDIHFESYEDEFRIRYRIDGVLYTLPTSARIRKFAGLIISRMKVMAGLDIAERRLPQDGRMTIKVGADNLNLRISILPTPYGEAVQVRVLTTNVFHLQELGFNEKDLISIENILQKPHGIIFVSGPTGSGKTTTLYACLHRLNVSTRKIITVEDPIEYQLKGVIQVQTQPSVGLTFDTALRSMLRHDPDVMLVGEVRDTETAKIAINIALTGHLVLSTLHSNDAAGTFTRLLDMGVEPHFVASSVECVIAQSLVRLLCPHCKQQVQLSDKYMKSIAFSNPSSEAVYTHKGCKMCQYTGYRGRTAIHEIIIMDDDIREMVLKREPAHVISRSISEKGIHTLRQSGFDKVRLGITSISEVLDASYG